MDTVSDSIVSIRAALNRKVLADARQRSALARQLALTDTDLLAIQHLARAGQLTPGQLSAQLQLSSAGTTGLVRRLQRAGHVMRNANPHDRRSAVVALTPAMQQTVTEAWGSLMAELDALALELPESQREAVRRFLQRAAHAAERHAERLARHADTEARDALAVPLPALWA